MVTKPRNLKELIASDVFMSISDEVCKKTHSVIFPLYNDTLFEATRNQTEKSGIPIEELVELLSEDREQFVRYVCASVLESRGESIEQEYPPSEKPDKDEVWVVRQELGLSRDFVVPHLIDYWYLLRNPGGLETYLKATRTPNAKKQAKKLIQLMETVISRRQ